MNRKTKIIPIFIPHHGCPNDCYFCNQKKITGKDSGIDFEAINKYIDEYYGTIENEKHDVEIAFFGGSFTAIDIEIQKKLLKKAYEYKVKKMIDRIRISTRPDAVNDEILDMLEDYGVDIIEIGVQSMNDEVLNIINRGHTSKDVKIASELIKSRKFILGHQIMPGLYGSSPEKDIVTALDSISLNPDLVRIYPTLIIRDTMLEELYSKKLYKPQSIEETVDLISIIYSLYAYEDINIIRVGLQPTDNINFEKDVVAGPFHPSFRQLILSNIISKVLVRKIKIESCENLTIKSNGKNINYIVGIKKTGVNRIKDVLNIKNIKFIKNNNLRDIIIEHYGGEIIVCFHEIFYEFIKLSKENYHALKRNCY
jgi:radical SAM enzyme (TIGR01210 family)